MRRPIAIFHPEGNYENNPHLSGVVSLLLERGQEVHLFCGALGIRGQERTVPGLRVFPVPPVPGHWEDLRGVLHQPDGPGARAMAWTAANVLPRYALAIGVDLGVVEAARLARAQGIPYGLISYELYFEEEVGPAFKQPEREVCGGLAFAVSQDEERAGLLARQNAIAPERILTMPVAGRGTRPAERSWSLHAALGLDRSVKLAVCIGSVEAAWAGMPELLADLVHWPDDWALVVHHRFGGAGLGDCLQALPERTAAKLHLSPYQGLPAEGMGLLLHACDLGLCFYTPTYAHPVLGRNLEHIGMASGKFATYLRHGLPILVNTSGEMAGHVQREGLGWRVDDVGQTHGVLAGLDRAALGAAKGRCLDFFARRLDLDATCGPLLELVDRLCSTSGAVAAPEAPQPEALALRGAARLRMAEDDAAGAAACLRESLELSRDAADVEAAYLIALRVHRMPGGVDPALGLYRAVAAHPLASAALAAWAQFKEGEAAVLAGRETEAREHFLRALESDPSHAKAALHLVRPDKPLRVRVGAVAPGPAGASGVQIPMDPLNAGLWGYYFGHRKPDMVEVVFGRVLDAGEAARLAAILAEWLAPGGQVRLAGAGPVAESVLARSGPVFRLVAKGPQEIR